MLQKQIYFEVWAARAAKKLFILKLFGLIFFNKFFTKFLIIPPTRKSSKTHGIY
jgi:hypothetical protein